LSPPPVISFAGAFRLALAFFLSVATPLAAAADDERSVVNYSYAVVFGTGVYKVGDQKALVLRAPLSRTLRDASPERPGMRLLLPVLAGFYDYEEITQGSAPGDAATLSFVPGLELEYLVNDRWRLRPYGQIGLGRDLENRENAIIYSAGVSSLYKFPKTDSRQFALGGMLGFTGFNPDDDDGQSIGILGAGVDIIHPYRIRIFNRETRLANYLVYYLYLDNPNFEQGDEQSKSVRGELEWGLALDFRKARQLMGIEIDRIGLGFRYGGDIKGVRVVTRFPF
jgi:hypothetical protein